MKYRAEPEDKSSFQHEIVYALNELEQALSVSIRKTKWLPLDEVWELLLNVNPNEEAKSYEVLFVKLIPVGITDKSKIIDLTDGKMDRCCY